MSVKKKKGPRNVTNTELARKILFIRLQSSLANTAQYYLQHTMVGLSLAR